MTHKDDSLDHSAPSSPTPFSSIIKDKRKKQMPIDWLEGPYNHTRGEMSLWVAVIMQAVSDAISKSKNAEAVYHKNEAIHWLTGNGKDFVMVCLCAGFDPDYVRRQAKRTIISPVAWRADAGKGKRYLERKAYRKRVKQAKQADQVKIAVEDEMRPSSNVICMHGRS